MAKVIKEIILMLLVCLIGILLFAVVFYEYIPSRKVVADVTTYTASSEVKELLADNVDETDNDIVASFQEGNYEVTSSDLSNYEATDTYVPGKSNPFAVVAEDVEGETEDTESTSDSNTTSNTTSGSSNSTNTSTSEYTKDTGTK